MTSTVCVLRLVAVIATLGTLVAIVPHGVLHADDEVGACADSSERVELTAESIASAPAQIDDEIIFTAAQSGGVVVGADIKTPCGASRNIEFFANRLDRPVIMVWKVTNGGDCELTITSSGGDIHIQRSGLADTGSSMAWISVMAPGETVKYSCQGGNAGGSCAFGYQIQVVQVLDAPARAAAPAP